MGYSNNNFDWVAILVANTIASIKKTYVDTLKENINKLDLEIAKAESKNLDTIPLLELRKCYVNQLDNYYAEIGRKRKKKKETIKKSLLIIGVSVAILAIVLFPHIKNAAITLSNNLSIAVIEPIKEKIVVTKLRKTDDTYKELEKFIESEDKYNNNPRLVSIGYFNNEPIYWIVTQLNDDRDIAIRHSCKDDKECYEMYEQFQIYEEISMIKEVNKNSARGPEIEIIFN